MIPIKQRLKIGTREEKIDFWSMPLRTHILPGHTSLEYIHCGTSIMQSTSTSHVSEWKRFWEGIPGLNHSIPPMVNQRHILHPFLTNAFGPSLGVAKRQYFNIAENSKSKVSFESQYKSLAVKIKDKLKRYQYKLAQFISILKRRNVGWKKMK